jgi:hypothetical protein
MFATAAGAAATLTPLAKVCAMADVTRLEVHVLRENADIMRGQA